MKYRTSRNEKAEGYDLRWQQEPGDPWIDVGFVYRNPDGGWEWDVFGSGHRPASERPTGHEKTKKQAVKAAVAAHRKYRKISGLSRVMGTRG